MTDVIALIFFFIPSLQPNPQKSSVAIELLSFIQSHVCITMVKTSNVIYLCLLSHRIYSYYSSMFQIVTKCANQSVLKKYVPVTDSY